MKAQGLALALVMGMGCVIFGQTREELQSQKQKAYDEIELAKELLDKAVDKKSASLQDLRIVQRGINSRSKLIKALEEEVKMLDAEIAELTGGIMRLEKENESNRKEYERLIYYAYRNHTNYEKLMYILAGESISQSYQRYKYLKYISDYRIKKMQEIKELVKELKGKREKLNGLKDNKLKLLEDRESEQRELVRERRKSAEIVEQLNQEERKLKREIEEKERIARELETRIRELIEEEARKTSAGNIYSALTPEQELVGNDFRRNKGKLPWPVERGIITAGFGNSEFPGLRGSSINNNGIDISSAPGTKVRAVFDGEVTKVFAILGANYNVLIRHGEFLSVYQNLVNVRVKTGDKVKAKDVLGEAFIDEKNDISMVHFEVWQERSILNPEDWLSK